LWGEDNFGCGLRFTNITIPRGARINYAYLELCAAWDDESQVRSKLHGQNTDDALSFSTLQDFDSRPWTSACVYWDDIPAWKTGTRYTSPDISMILQEIVDRSNWQSGNSVVVIWEDFESRSISYIENSRRAWSFDGNPSLAPKLLIDYEDVIPPTIVILSPQNTSYYGSIPLTFTVDEPVSWIGCSLDNQANVTTVGDTILTGLAGGSHTIVVYANDTSGNMGASDKVFFTVQLPPKYALTVQSSPSGIAFTANSVSHVTPWSGTFDEGSSIVLMMPETHVNGEAKYVWDRWNDGETSRSRTVTTNTDISLTANFAGPYYQLTVTSSPITGIPFTINAVPKTTPYVDWLLEGSYSLEMPQTYNGYNWSRWLEDGDASRIKTIHHHGNTWTGVYEWTKIAVPIKGGENATVEGNVTITNVLVTKNTLHFDASGPPGSTGWINVTFPMVNTTNLKVFINNEKLTPPPFPIITTNGTHYFIYFEFTLSTKSIAILFSLEPPIADFTWSPSIPKSNQPVTFDGSSSSADNASIVSYEWDFGDGTHSFGQIVTHSYTASGFYTVTLNVTDSEGFWDIEQKQVQVEALPIPPPLSASINPLSASILLGQSVTFTSTVSGGYSPYSYQWYLNGASVSGATSASWTFTPTTSGIYYVYLKVTDAKGNTAQSDAARITVATVPVGGYSIPIQVQTKTEPIIPYIALIAILTAIFTKLKPKNKRKR
jgi:PKD repeat protein